MMTQQVREVMTSDPVALQPETTVVEAARQMRDHDIGDVFVVDGERLCGVVTDRDIVVRGLATGASPTETTLGDICSEDIAAVRPDDDTRHVVAFMRERAIRRVPVIDHDQLVGVVSIGDMAIEDDERSALADISAAPANT